MSINAKLGRWCATKPALMCALNCVATVLWIAQAIIWFNRGGLLAFVWILICTAGVLLSIPGAVMWWVVVKETKTTETKL